MYHFALVALMALAVVKVVDVLTDNVEALQRFRSLLTIAFGVGIVHVARLLDLRWMEHRHRRPGHRASGSRASWSPA